MFWKIGRFNLSIRSDGTYNVSSKNSEKFIINLEDALEDHLLAYMRRLWAHYEGKSKDAFHSFSSDTNFHPFIDGFTIEDMIEQDEYIRKVRFVNIFNKTFGTEFNANVL